MNEEVDNQAAYLELVKSNDRVVFDERRRLPRLYLTHEQFRLLPNKIVFSVLDLSLEGMGIALLVPEDLSFFTLGSIVQGILKLQDKKFDIQAKVRNLTKARIGLEFYQLSLEAANVISSFLDPKSLGVELKPIPPPQGLNVLWYHGPTGTDLLIYRSPIGEVTKLSLYVLGNYVEWDVLKGVRTGTYLPSNMNFELSGIVRFETLFLVQDSQPDLKKLTIAKTVVLSSNLPRELKSKCARQLNLI